MQSDIGKRFRRHNRNFSFKNKIQEAVENIRKITGTRIHNPNLNCQQTVGQADQTIVFVSFFKTIMRPMPLYFLIQTCNMY